MIPSSVLLLLLVFPSLSVQAEKEYVNPVIQVDAPDPGVLFFKSKFWSVTTSQVVPAFPIRSSTDLVNWKDEGFVFKGASELPEWATGNDLWAPELHELGGMIVCYFTARGKDGRLAIGGAWSTSGSPVGPYAAFAGRIAAHENGAIDGHVARDNRTGESYLVWKVDGNSVLKPTPIVAQKISADGSKLVTDPVELIRQTETWEGTPPLVEGPWIVFRNGMYWLFFSAACYANSGYAIGVARSKSLLGPYEKSAAPLVSQFADGAPAHPFSGPGHCSVVMSPNGAHYMVFHSWLRGRTGQSPGRLVLVDRVWWDDSGQNDGWPVVGDAGTPSSRPLPLPISEESAMMPMEIRVRTDGSKYSFASFQWRDHCWESSGSIDGSCSDSLFHVRPGKVGGETVSIESTATPGTFWRHRNGELHLDRDDGSDLFKHDCSFMPVAGLGDSALLSLRPQGYPDHFVRHQFGRLKISRWDGSAQMAQDATWAPIQH